MSNFKIEPHVISVDTADRTANIERLGHIIPKLAIFKAIDTRTPELFNRAVNAHRQFSIVHPRLLSQYRNNATYHRESGKLGCHLSHALLWRQILRHQQTDPSFSDKAALNEKFYWIMEDDISAEEGMTEKVREVLAHLTPQQLEGALFIRFYSYPTRDRQQFDPKNRISGSFFYHDKTTGFVSYLANYRGLYQLYRHVPSLTSNIDTIAPPGLTRLVPPPKYLHDTRSLGSRRKVDMLSSISGTKYLKRPIG